MTTTIITKNSSTASAVPLAGSLVQGELAVNVTDKKLYTKDSSATVVKVVGSLGNQEANAVAITGGTVAGVAQTGGTINNTPIGATTASTVRGTTVTATTGFSGDLTGNVTGNTTGTHTGAVTGNVTGNLTGNVTAASGTSTFNHVTISGSLDMDAGTTATITGLATPVNNTDAATKIYVDTAISNLVDGAPANLDTLNEIAAALNDDANLAATLTASIATKVSKAGDSMTGALAMGNNKITGLGTPTAGTDATTKTYVDTADALKLNLSGGTMTGNIVMGANKVTSTATPTVDDDLTRKGYVDSILGSATSAAASASAAATSATNAANSASASADSATASAASASSAAASYDSFDDRYLGAKASAPSVDNDGNALLTGALYWNSTNGELNVWSGSAWVPSTLTTGSQTISGVKTFSNNPVLSGGTANGVAYLNGSKVLTTGTALQFDGSNLGLGVTPSASSASGVLFFKSGGQFSFSGPVAYQDVNVAYSSGADRYIANGAATRFASVNGVMSWQNAPSGTAGNAISFTQAMTLDALGQLLVNGTSTPFTSSGRGIVNINGSSQALLGLTVGGVDKGYLYTDGTNTTLSNSPAGSLIFATNAGTERARIDSSGNLLVGTTTTSATNSRSLVFDKANGRAYVQHDTGNVSGDYYHLFYYNSSAIGSITQNGTTAVLYNVTSDQRLKENIQDAASASALIDSLQVRQYEWKSDGSHQRYGFIAQELVTVVPEAVHQPINPDDMMAVDYSKLVPMLVKEIQSLRQRLAAAGI